MTLKRQNPSYNPSLKLEVYDAVYLTDSFVFTIDHCVNFTAVGYESISFNRIKGEKSRRVILNLS